MIRRASQGVPRRARKVAPATFSPGVDGRPPREVQLSPFGQRTATPPKTMGIVASNGPGPPPDTSANRTYRKLTPMVSGRRRSQHFAVTQDPAARSEHPGLIDGRNWLIPTVERGGEPSCTRARVPSPVILSGSSLDWRYKLFIISDMLDDDVLYRLVKQG